MRVHHGKNLWAASVDLEPQRTDLWQLDAELAATALFRSAGLSPALSQSVFYAQSVVLPTLGVKAEEFRRESRPYLMPSFDEAIGQVKVTFVLDVGDADFRVSRLYRFLDTWRGVVRGGRGSYTTEREVELDESYKLPYRHDLLFRLVHGVGDGSWLETTTTLTLEQAWLVNFQLPEFNYQSSQAAIITANFAVENVLENDVKVK